ncbi:MAG: recombinase family protein [Deltaproteobacteria bacterium]|nr:recombinase family protein [Deltaproteobacteria bacterium]
MKLAIYARVSTSHNGQNPETQLIPLREYVKSRGFVVFKEYVDFASGIKEKRANLSQLLIDARKRKFDTVLVWKLDRLGRSLKHLVSLIEEFHALGIQFISYSEGMDTTTPSGKLLFNIVGSIAAFERDLIRERVKAGLDRSRAQGKRLGRPTIQYKTEQIKILKEQGLSTRSIAKEIGVSNATISRVLQNPQKYVSISC